VTKQEFLKEAMMARGLFRDMCLTCSLSIDKDELQCWGCPEAWRKLPKCPVEYYRQPSHSEGGNA